MLVHSLDEYVPFTMLGIGETSHIYFFPLLFMLFSDSGYQLCPHCLQLPLPCLNFCSFCRLQFMSGRTLRWPTKFSFPGVHLLYISCTVNMIGWHFCDEFMTSGTVGFRKVRLAGWTRPNDMNSLNLDLESETKGVRNVI